MQAYEDRQNNAAAQLGAFVSVVGTWMTRTHDLTETLHSQVQTLQTEKEEFQEALQKASDEADNVSADFAEERAALEQALQDALQEASVLSDDAQAAEVCISATCLAETSVSSPRKLFIFII